MGEALKGLAAIGAALLAGAAIKHAADKPWTQVLPQAYRPGTTVAPTTSPQSDRKVIVSATIADQSCRVAGSANDAPMSIRIDSGNYMFASFSASYLGRLGINPSSLSWIDMSPGTPYGKHAFVTLREIRIGDVVWRNPKVEILQKWNYTFGDDDTPLLGVPALNSRNIYVEVDGDVCRLTVPRSAATRS